MVIQVIHSESPQLGTGSSQKGGPNTAPCTAMLVSGRADGSKQHEMEVSRQKLTRLQLDPRRNPNFGA